MRDDSWVDDDDGGGGDDDDGDDDDVDYDNDDGDGDGHDLFEYLADDNGYNYDDTYMSHIM